ncbi:MAG TPA: ABC transporter permease [Vicinamibacterales bacterium]|nr:ABC transporter permease [Vicinamibacterales bacterium]
MTLGRLARIVRHRVASIWRPRALDREVSSELAFHVDALTKEGIEAGLSPEQARRAAHRALGNTALLEEECRDQRHVRWWHDFQQDLVYGWRVLRRQPGFTAAAIASLALGIGANAAILGVIDAVLVRRLPFPDADRLVVIRTARDDQPDQLTGVSLADYLDWSERQRSFQSLGLSMPWPADLGADPGGQPAERLLGQLVTAETFETLGAQAAIGRTFTREEGKLTSPTHVVVISDGLWRRRFGGDPGIVGKPILLDQMARTVVGIMPAAFQYRDARADFWLPLIVNTRPGQNPSRLYGIVGRLKPGVTLDAASAEFQALDTQLASDAPDRHGGWTSQLFTLRDSMYAWTLRPVLTLQVAVALLLVLTCVNIAALLLIRGVARGPEIRLRLALGAGQSRIARQLLAEGVLLSAAGGAAGVLVAWLGLHGIEAAIAPPLGQARMPELGLGVRVIGAALMLSCGSVLLFGLVPALRTARVATRVDREVVPHVRASGWLVATEVAMATVLLVGAVLLTRSFVLVSTRDLGFDPSGLVTFDYRAPAWLPRQIGEYQGFQYFEINPAPARTLERIFDRLQQVPGVESAAGSAHPLLDSATTAIVPAVSAESSARLDVAYDIVTPGFFTAMRSTRFRGRDFAASDRVTTPWVVIVNESAARAIWPHQDAVGQRLTLDIVPEERPREVIGVVSDIPLQRTQVGAQPVVYTSFLQQPSRFRAPWAGLLGQMNFVVRRARPDLDVMPAVRLAVAEIEPTRPIGNAAEMSDLSPVLRVRQSYALAMAVFAGVAVLLAAMGVYGVMARAVTERTKEIGIRRALGADSTDVVTLLGRRTSWLTVTGLGAGLAIALVLTRLIASQLWGVSPGDPLTYLASAILVVAAATAASVVPGRRAIAVDPGTVLKSE